MANKRHESEEIVTKLRQTLSFGGGLRVSSPWYCSEPLLTETRYLFQGNPAQPAPSQTSPRANANYSCRSPSNPIEGVFGIAPFPLSHKCL